MARDYDETDWRAITRNVLLLVLLLAGIAVWKWRQSKPAVVATRETPSARTAPAAPSKAPAPSKDTRMNLSPLSPLVIGEKAVTADEARPPLLAWLEKTFQVNGLTPEPALLKNEQWKPFARGVAWAASGDPRSPSSVELHSMARDLAPVAKEHPLAAFLVGTILTGEAGSLALLEKATTQFTETPGSETLAFRAAAGLALATLYDESLDASANLEEEMKKRYDAATKRADAALAALRRALDAEKGYAKEHDRVIAYVLKQQIADTFFSSMHERVAEEVAKTEGMKPWVKKWIEGEHCLQKAWDARGGGYASTVTDDGSAIFQHESEKGRRLLQEAWEMNPEDPSPAVTLIYSALSMGKRQAPGFMRQWFDRVLQLQVDAPGAAQNFLWGLRPRWYGSHQQMKDFGLACANTRRHDSGLPWILLQAHRDCASEWDVPDAYFKELNPGSYSDLRLVLEGAEAEEKRAPWRNVDRTHSAVFEFKCGHYEEAQKWLDKLESKPNGGVLLEWGMDSDLLLGKTAAFAKGDTAGALRNAEAAEQNFRSGDAFTLYRSALEASKDKVSEVGRKYLESRMAITSIESQLDQAGVAALMPDANFAAWSQRGGGWRIVQDALTHWGRGRISSTTCQARIGPVFTAEGEIEVIDPGEGCQVWLSYGYPERGDKTRWIAVRFAYDKGKTRALLSNGMGEPLEYPEIKAPPRFRFRLLATANGLSLFVDDAPAFQNVPLPTAFVRERYSQMGLGAATQSDQTRVKVHALTVKR